MKQVIILLATTPHFLSSVARVNLRWRNALQQSKLASYGNVLLPRLCRGHEQ